MSDDVRPPNHSGTAASGGQPSAAGGDVSETLKALQALDAQIHPPTSSAPTSSAPTPRAGDTKAVPASGSAPTPTVGPADRPAPPLTDRPEGPARNARPAPDPSEARQATAAAPSTAATTSVVVWEPPAAAAPPEPPIKERSPGRPFAIAAGLAAIALLGGIGINALRGGGGAPPIATAAVTPATPAPDAKVAGIVAADTGANDRLDRLTADVAALKDQLALLATSTKAAASGADLTAVRDRLAALDGSLDALRQSTRARAPATPSTASETSAADTERVAQLTDRIAKLERQLATGSTAAAVVAPAPKPIASAVNPSVPAKEPVAVKESVAVAAPPKPAPKPAPRPVELAKAAPEARAVDHANEARGLAELRPPSDIPDPRTRQARGWVLRDLYDGTALIEDRDGGVLEVLPGQRVAGLGRIERIERRGTGWVVVTERGYIPSAGY